MNSKIVIRPESGADVRAISEVTVSAFRILEISNHTEQFIIAALRAVGALTVSLVAEMDGRVVGTSPSLPCSYQTARGTGTVLGLSRCCRNSSGRASARP